MNLSYWEYKTWLSNVGFTVIGSGIMGVGKQKTPIVKRVSNTIMCGVRLGGMGVALGSLVGKELAGLVD